MISSGFQPKFIPDFTNALRAYVLSQRDDEEALRMDKLLTDPDLDLFSMMVR